MYEITYTNDVSIISKGRRIIRLFSAMGSKVSSKESERRVQRKTLIEEFTRIPL